MKRILKGLGVGLLAVTLVAGAGAAWKAEELTRLLAVNTLFQEDRIVENFSRMDRLFHHVVMEGGTPAPLPRGPEAAMPEGFEDWIAARGITGIVVLKDGAIAHESYHRGTADDDRRISWSIAKSVLSLLLGVLHHEGAIPDLDAPVTDYVPDLSASAYDGVTIRQVAQMASGVAFDENYLDQRSDINRMGRVLALGGTMDGFTIGQTGRRAPAGESWQYVSIDTHVLGMVIRGATGRSVAELASERLFQPLGMDRDPIYLTDGHGVEFVLGGLKMTTRDYARIGQLVAQGGDWRGEQLVPAEWIAESTARSAPGVSHYGYQWWLPQGGDEVYGRGVYGQYLWIDPARQVVIAVNAADRNFRGAGVPRGNIAMFRAIASGL